MLIGPAPLVGEQIASCQSVSNFSRSLFDRLRSSALVLRLTNPNFYLLDEPTNHLDIEGQEALESELIAHQTSCLFVSHDRSFVRAGGNRFWAIERKRLLELESPEEFFSGSAD